jgi:hypothetical protein
MNLYRSVYKRLGEEQRNALLSRLALTPDASVVR